MRRIGGGGSGVRRIGGGSSGVRRIGGGGVESKGGGR